MGLDAESVQSAWVSTATTEVWTAVSIPAISTVVVPSEDDVARAFDVLIERRIQCGRIPDDCDITRLAAQGSPMFDRLSDLMAERVESGITASDQGSISVRIDDVTLTHPGRAIVSTCLVDDTVLVLDAAVYDDSVYSARSEWTLVASHGEWLWNDERVVEWAVERDLCVSE